LRKIDLFDGHCDTLLRCWHTDWSEYNGGSLRENTGHIDLLRARRSFGSYCQFFAIFASSVKKEQEERIRALRDQLAIFKRETAANADLVAHCRTAEQAEQTLKQGKIAAFLAVEGAELLGCNMDILEEAYEAGVRAVNLTWNYENAVSGSNAEGADKGLTEYGKAFVRRMQELGMIVDVSHLSDPGFWDVAELSAQVSKPFMAGHSNSRTIYNHSRNLTDEQFLAIVKAGGVAGVNAADELLSDREPSVDTIIANIEHWMGLGGKDSVAIGADFDGCTPCAGIRDVTDLSVVYERLLRMNYSESQVHAIFFDNMMRVVREVCTM